MKHAIDTLQAEDDRLTAEITKATSSGRPAGWRSSEWAMHMASLKQKRLDTFEAIQALKGVGRE